MIKINHLIKVILVSSILFILECAQLGGRTEEYYGGYVHGKFGASSFEIKVRPDKIFTPNGDGWNDYLEIQYDNPYDAIVSGKIYDIKGRLVARMAKEESKERLTWNGNDLNNDPVVGGLYIFQVEVSGPENKVIKGIIVLVR